MVISFRAQLIIAKINPGEKEYVYSLLSNFAEKHRYHEKIIIIINKNCFMIVANAQYERCIASTKRGG